MPEDPHNTEPNSGATAAAAPPLSDEEQRLRERLKSKQEKKELDQREDIMRSKLKEKAERRRSSGGYSSASAPPDEERGRSREREGSHHSSARSRSRDRDHHLHHRRNGHHDHRRRNGHHSRHPPHDDYYAPRGPHYSYYPADYPPRLHRGGDLRRGPPPPRHSDELDDFGRRRPVGSRSRSQSRGSSYYASSYSEPEEDDRSRSRSRSRSRGRRYRRSRSRSSSVSSASSASSYSSYSSNSTSSSRSSVSSAGDKKTATDNAFTKDQRTVFVNQLVMRTTERDLKKYFKGKGLGVNDVILLRDKRTGRHKGCAYVTLRNMNDVAQACSLTGQAPDFQRFPILIKASEAEKNYITAAAPKMEPLSVPTKVAPVVGPNGKLLESQRVYVGSLDSSITQQHLYALFSPFGSLKKVALQTDPATGISKGFCFLTYSDPKEANLAIQACSGQVLAGRPMKTGWAKHAAPSASNIEIVTSEEFPPDASTRTQQAYSALAQLNMGVISGAAVSPTSTAGVAATPTSVATAPTAVAATTTAAAAAAPPRPGTVAEARASLAAAANAGGAAGMAVPMIATATTSTTTATLTQTDPTVVGNADHPTAILLVHNMFNKDQETEPNWEKDLEVDFVEECSKFGKILEIKVMSQEPGGKVYAKFDSIENAQKCAATLAGRWFDKRQLCVEFVSALP